MKRTLALLSALCLTLLSLPSLVAQVSNPTLSTSTLTSLKWTVVTWETWSNQEYSFPVEAGGNGGCSRMTQSGWKRIMRNDTGATQTVKWVSVDNTQIGWGYYNGSHSPMNGSSSESTMTVQPGDTIEEDFHYVETDNLVRASAYTSVTSITAANKAQTISLSVNGNSSVSVDTGTSVTFNVSGGSTSYSWSVSPAASGFSGPSSSGSQSYGFSFGAEGDYTVSVQAPAGTGYSASNVSSVTVRVRDKNALTQTVSLSADKTAVVAGGSVTFKFGGGQTEYVWSGISGPTSGVSTTATFSTAGSYTVSLYAKADATYSQSNTASVTIAVSAPARVNQAPVSISPSEVTVKQGESCQLTASGGSTGTYSWGGESSGSGSSCWVSFDSPGAYEVTVYSPATSTYNASNTATATVTVEEYEDPNPLVLMVYPITPRLPASVRLSTSGGGSGNVTYAITGWTGSGNLADCGTLVGNTFTAKAVGSVTFTAYQEAAGGQPARSASATALILGAYQPNVSSANISVPLGTSSVPLSLNGGAGTGEWLWAVGDSDATSVKGLKWSAAGSLTQGIGIYNFWVRKLGDSYYEQSNFAGPYRLTVTWPKPVTLLSFEPLASTMTVSDPTHPAYGKTYPRLWQSGAAWKAYLARSGLRFLVKGKATAAVGRFELEVQEPGTGIWKELASATPTSGASGVEQEHLFSVCFDEPVPGSELIPLSYKQGAPKVGPWQLRARVLDTKGEASEWSSIVSVEAELPIATVSETVQTLPPAGHEGLWYSASAPKTFTLKVWIP